MLLYMYLAQSLFAGEGDEKTPQVLVGLVREIPEGRILESHEDDRVVLRSLALVDGDDRYRLVAGEVGNACGQSPAALWHFHR